MAHLRDSLIALWRDEEGATMVEYALLVALIAVVALAGAKNLGQSANDTLDGASTKIAGP